MTRQALVGARDHVAKLLVRTSWLLTSVFVVAGCSGAPVEPGPQTTPGMAGNAGGFWQSGAAGAGGSGPTVGGGGGSTGGSTPATGGGGLGSGGAPTGGSGMVGVFVAQGHEGRITRSCDDGLTFPYNHSADDAYRCFSDAEHDCDHSELAGRGLAFGAGTFVATWGWGHNSLVQRSLDGKTFSDVSVTTDNATFADLAFGKDLFVACGNPTRVSNDGMTWEIGGPLTFDFNYRGIEFVPAGGGTFIVTGESGEQRAISYSRDGKAWLAPSERPATCGQSLRGVAGSDSVIILASGQGHVCRSLDGGDKWTQKQVTERFTSQPLWTGTEFWIYSGNQLFRSGDGDEWTSQAVVPNNIQIGTLARSPGGTLVAANDGWQVWYDQQRLFRSTDGVTFSVLEPEVAITGSHPINFVSFGYVPASADCGGP